MGMIQRPKTSKQRHRQAEERGRLRENAAGRRAAKKAGKMKHTGTKKARATRASKITTSSRTAGELVAEVNSGKVHASLDESSARSLADLLKVKVDNPDADAKPKYQLSVERVAALPKNETIEKLNKQIDEEEDQSHVVTAKRNNNHYARRGPAMAFWERVETHPLLLAALRDMNFTHPTPIQHETLTSTMCVDKGTRNDNFIRSNASKDYVVSAETGSGKTLVFALPILQRILMEKTKKGTLVTSDRALPGYRRTRAEANLEEEEENAQEDEEEEADEPADEEHAEGADEEGAAGDGEEADEEAEDFAEDEEEEAEEEGLDPLSDEAVGAIRVLHSLILTPTRELAIQIHECMKQLSKYCGRNVQVACIVGGMAPSKQQRILNRCPDVLICTPGRLWDLVQKNEGAFLGHSISRRLSCFVLDEADRLIESGKFEELQKILERVRCDILPRGLDTDNNDNLCEGVWDDATKTFVPKTKVRATKKDEPRPMPMPPPPEPNHRTAIFVTSATLSLQVNFQNKNVREKKILRTKNADTMKLVMNDLGLRDKTSAIFNLAPDANVVAKLQETYLRCPETSKELYLYCFLKQYCTTGRTIVFVNAISMLRRLVKILEILHIPVVGLHASMQQRQRLKVIDKFRAGTKPVLIATDVAARGLDVEGVKYVVHYQLPRSTDGYIHRCGRTARCGGEGFSCVFVHPDEYNPYKQLMQSMGRSSKLEVLALDQTVARRLHPHHKLALEIDRLSRSVRKTNANQGWVSRMAEDADLDAGDMVDDESGQEIREKTKVSKVLQRRLEAMLRQDSTASKGGYLSAPRKLGATQAVAGVHARAARQIKLHRTEK
jgi:ATP-dependent RNA helicase DDX24/MAK5